MHPWVAATQKTHTKNPCDLDLWVRPWNSMGF